MSPPFSLSFLPPPPLRGRSARSAGWGVLVMLSRCQPAGRTGTPHPSALRAADLPLKGGGAVNRLMCVVVFTLVGCAAVAIPGLAADTDPQPVVRRLTPDQYRHIIADIFGPTVTIDGRFEPDVRTDGLLAVGAGRVSVTAAGLEQYDAIARGIAAQVVDERHRGTLIPCQPASPTAPDDSCARKFIASVGPLLFRRPIRDDEVAAQVAVAHEAAAKLKDFYAGLGMSLAGMLDSLQFLFRQEQAVPDRQNAGAYTLDPYSRATRLSFLLWDTKPDAELLAAAASGALERRSGLERQVDRMLASPRLADGVRAFFTDMLQFDQFTTLSKDAAIYPKFTFKVAADAEEQTLRTVTDHLLTRHGDYRDLFTTRKTFLTPLLGSIYDVPVARGAPGAWQPYEFAEGDPRAGILMEASFVALHSHPGRSSPTLRGKALREVLLCQKVPDPPGNVNFAVVQDSNNPNLKTTRARLTAHRTEPTCAGCHKLMDPMGLAMENFDSSGGFRTTENGVPIDTSGELDGVKFTDAAGLARAVHDNPATVACLVDRLYSYATGRPPAKSEAEWLAALRKGFADDGYRMPELLRRIATSPEFYRVVAPRLGGSAEERRS